MIEYQLEPQLSPEDFIAVLISSGLAARRPIDDLQTISGMLQNAAVIVTARQNGQIVGVSRAITDYHYCTYLSDLAVDKSQQGLGIGKQLIDKTHEAAGRHTRLILISAPAAVEYYPKIGMENHPSCWMIAPNTRLPGK